MSSKKGAGTTRINKDSQSKRLGVKRFGSEAVSVGNIIIRQKGNKYNSGMGTKQGNDYTIYAAVQGKVAFTTRRGKRVVEVHG